MMGTSNNDTTPGIERLLQRAATFEPESPAPQGLARRALFPQKRRPVLWLSPAFGVAVAACALVGAALLPRLHQPIVRPAGVRPAEIRPTVAPAATLAHTGASEPGRPTERLASTGARPTAERPHTHRSARTQLALGGKPPRVRWTVERVPETRMGVLTPAWATHVDENGAVIASPVVLESPIAGPDRSGSADNGTFRIIPASYSEVNR